MVVCFEVETEEVSAFDTEDEDAEAGLAVGCEEEEEEEEEEASPSMASERKEDLIPPPPPP